MRVPSTALRRRWRRVPTVPGDLRHVLAWFLATRAGLTVVGLLSLRVMSPWLPEWRLIESYPRSPALGAWVGGDTQSYLSIAQHGYDRCSTAPTDWPGIGFFPLYPLLIRVGSWLTRSDAAAGVIFSNLCLLLGAGFLYRLIRLDEDEDHARRCTRMLFVSPVGFFLSAIQTEGLFFLLVVLCFYAARRNRWWLAGTCGFLASLTRPTGVVVLAPLCWMFATQRGVRILREGFYLLLVPLGLLAVGAYEYLVSGDLFAYAHAQERSLGHHLANPVVVLYQGMLTSDPNVAINAWAAYAALCLLIFSSRHLRVEYTLFAVLVILAGPITGTAAGSLRYLSPLFPLVLALSRPRLGEEGERIFCAVLLLLQGCLMVLWVGGFYLLC